MERRRLRDLVAGATPAPDRVCLLSLWFRDHNNPRYAELFPRLTRLDRYLVLTSEHRIRRGLQYRAYRYGRALHYPALLRLASRRYRSLFTADNDQIPHFEGPVVADVDDPRYTPSDVRALRRPNLAAYVVTAERAARRYESLGVEKPYYVIPQGVSVSSLDPALISDAASRRAPETIVVGWMAAHLLSDGDRGGESPLYNVDHLLELWDEIHARLPAGQLWLVGRASERVLRRIDGREDILHWGRLPRERMLAVAKNFDLALYPRTRDQGIQAAKVGEFIGLGIPTVSYDYAVTENLRETGAGVLVQTPREFVDAVVNLGGDDAARAEIAAAARRAGEALDWDVLVRRYEEILDRHLPRS